MTIYTTLLTVFGILGVLNGMVKFFSWPDYAYVYMNVVYAPILVTIALIAQWFITGGMVEFNHP